MRMRLMWRRAWAPSPAMVVALAALFVALSGSATAAVLITGGSIKNGTIRGIDVRNGGLTGLDVKNDTLSGLDVRESSLGRVPAAASALNARNAASAGNAQTLDGLDSSNLVPGGVIPSGRTVTGTYGVWYAATAPNQVGFASFSFGASLAAAPSSLNFMEFGRAPSQRCPGSAADPQAAAGNLCVYEESFSNAGARCIALRPDCSYSLGQLRLGAGVWVASAALGVTRSAGTWAVTAP